LSSYDLGGSGGSGSGRNNKKAVIKKERLKDAVKDNTWTINNLLDEKYPSRKADDIVKLALSMVDAEAGYNLLENNCEHFATMLRYGKSESRQVSLPVPCTTNLAEHTQTFLGKPGSTVTQLAIRVKWYHEVHL
jgi:hypothetical protein